jgi:hypothetical protein
MIRSALLLLLACTVAAEAQNIGVKTISPGTATRILVSPALTTTLLLPSVPSGVFGLGLISGESNAPGSIQISHPDGSNVIVLHALTDTARVVATVLLDGKLFVLALEASPTPDVAITLAYKDSSSDPTSAPKAQPLTAEEIVAQRLRYDPELLIGFLRRARDVNILRPIQPALYDGYKSKDVQYSSENQGVYKTTVVTIHRFSKDDVTILQGCVENESDHPLTFDGRAVTVLVANEVHPAKIVDCARPIPPHARTLIDVALEGDVDGSRANLSIENEFRIQLPLAGPVWNLKNGGSTPSAPGPIQPPVKMQNVPMAQVKKEG